MERRYVDLENRCTKFALAVRKTFRNYWKNGYLQNDIRQIVRSSGSIAANYIEANDNLGVRDFLLRVKISKKEAKESKLWLFLLKNTIEEENVKIDIDNLMKESNELMKIMAAIIKKRKI